MDSLHHAFAIAKGDSARLATALAIIENLEEREFDEAKRWLDTTEMAAKQMAVYPLGAKWVQYKASWLLEIGDVEDAYKVAMDAAAKLRALNDKSSLGRVLFTAGTALSEFNPKAAIEVMKESVALAQSIGDKDSEARSLTNLAYAYEMADLNLTEPYREALESSLVIFKELGYLDGILINNFNLVEYHSAKGNYARAASCIAEMRRYLVGVDDELTQAFPEVAEGTVLRAQGKLEAALPKFERSFSIARKSGVWDSQWELYPILIDLYKQTGRHKQAFEYMEEYQIMKDSMISIEKNKTVQQLQTRYETEKKEAQIAVQQADLARSQKEKWALAAGLAVLGGLAVLFWRQRRKTLAANLELAKSNEEIAEKNQKLDLLMRELHHRVKNNLQLVSSLLRLQSRQIGDENAAAAIKAGQLRVEAMSLIHQRLYREEGISMVNMQEFTQDLLEKIAFAFGHSLDAMEVGIMFEPKELDVDKAMPLSLILNELLTNSFKYAFGQTTRPAIRVQLSFLGEKLQLHYSDNGIGMLEPTSSTNSFGSKLIASLSGQLGGQARHWSENGAHFELIFSVG